MSDADLSVHDSGPYSAGAISSIAFGRRAAMVDGNVTRVLSRLTAFHAPATAKATTNYIWALADLLVPSNKVKGNDEEHIAVGGPNKSGAWNQALMELGATVCTPKSPRCGECPLSEECLAYAEVSRAEACCESSTVASHAACADVAPDAGSLRRRSTLQFSSSSDGYDICRRY